MLEVRVRICKRCQGSRWLLRPDDKLPVRLWYKACTDCDNSGMRPADKYLRIYQRSQQPPPRH